MVLAVLEYTKNDELGGSQENLIINTCKKDEGLMITVLQGGAAFTATVSPESSCVKRWATRLQLTASEYLEQLEAALQLSAQHSACTQSTAPENSAINTNKTPESKGPEHVFEISNETLAWKQYFADKKVHGKRGAIPLDQESISTATCCMLREAAQQQRDTLHELQRLREHNQTLVKERDIAADVAKQGVSLLEQFRQQTYAKFSLLLNSKKQKIRELTQQLKDSNPAAVTATVFGVSARPSTSSGEPVAKRSNVGVVCGRGKVPSTTLAAASVNTHDDDEDFDDDTDVDDNLQDVEEECNTDEEKELVAERRINVPKANLCPASGRPLAGASNTNLSASSNDSKEDCQGASSLTTKRKEIDNTAFSLSSNKRQSVFDSQDDLFNMSQEEVRDSLLSNIRPRNEGVETGKNLT